MLGINTPRGPRPDDFGLAAVPGREEEAIAAITSTIDFADRISAASVHVLAGNSSGKVAKHGYIEQLRTAAQTASGFGITILIEPLNQFDAPGYFLKDLAQAMDIIDEAGAPNIKLMFDCYHVGRTEGDVIGWLGRCADYIGHIQFASVPDRGPPDVGVLDYRKVFAAVREIGWVRPVGAEYVPGGATEDSLEWMKSLASDEN